MTRAELIARLLALRDRGCGLPAGRELIDACLRALGRK